MVKSVHKLKQLFLGVAVTLLLASCGASDRDIENEISGVVKASANASEHRLLGEFPALLSDWKLLQISDGELIPDERSVPYDLNTPLFSDYSHKFRTLWLPKDEAANFDGEGKIHFPVGTIVTKTFFYPRDGERLLARQSETDDFGAAGLNLDEVRLIETRLLIHRADGWQGLPYVWNEDQTEATLELAGISLELSLYAESGNESKALHNFTYAVPDFNQCQGCHIENLTTGQMAPIGLKPRHINKPYAHFHEPKNQIDHFVQAGLLNENPYGSLNTLSTNAMGHNQEADLNHRARSYLDINCGHCHNPTGAADTSGLFLNISETSPFRLGVCKPPIAAGQGTGGRFVSIEPGDPDASILSYRMQSLDLGAMMPELGRATVDHEGLKLINTWIKAMSGECNLDGVKLI